MKNFIKISSILLLTLFAYVNNVNADTYNAVHFYDSFSTDISYYNQNVSLYNSLVSYYESNYEATCGYYGVVISPSATDYVFTLKCSNYNFTGWDDYSHVYSFNKTFFGNNPSDYVEYTISITSNGTIEQTPEYGLYLYFYYERYGTQSTALYTNFLYSDNDRFYDFDTMIIPEYNDPQHNITIPSFEIRNNNLFPSYLSLYDGSYEDEYLVGYNSVNLNDYSYVILTLKNYNQQPFDSIIYTQGQLCLTPVYNYGMTQKNEYYQGYQVPSCSPYYSSSSPVPVYILQQDLDNHAVYYIKSPDISAVNTIMYDTRVFNLFTFNSSTEDNPSVVIDGRSYPTIPYDDLTDTAIISTDEGYISGKVCAVGDINCSAEATGIDITNLFTHPLELLESLWNNIITFFGIITAFITVLPPTLQTFLYVAFMLAVILGIIKMIIT